MISKLPAHVHFCLVVSDYVLEEIGKVAYLTTPSAVYTFTNGLGDVDSDRLSTKLVDQIVAHLQKFNGRTTFPTSFQQAIFASTLKSPTPEMEYGRKLKQAFAGFCTVATILSLTTSAIAQCKEPPTKAELDAMPTVYQEGMTDEQIEEALRKAMPEFGFCADGKNADSQICKPGKDGNVGSVESAEGNAIAAVTAADKKEPEGESACTKDPKKKGCEVNKDGTVGIAS
jgi:hypothetical protein